MPQTQARFANEVSKAFVSLFKSTLIGFIAFTIGCVSPFIAVRTFCAIGACMYIFGFMNTLTFFCACLYYDHLRILDGKCYLDHNDCCSLFTCDSHGTFFCKGQCVLDEYNDTKVRYFEGVLIGKFQPFLLKNIVRFIIIIFFLFISACGIAGAIKINHEFQVDWLIVSTDSQIYDAIQIRDDYFGGRGYNIGYYTKDVDFSKKSVQEEIKVLTSEIKACKDCEEEWIHEYSVFS